MHRTLPGFRPLALVTLAGIGLAAALTAGCGSGSSAASGSGSGSGSGSVSGGTQTTVEAPAATTSDDAMGGCADAQPEIEAAAQASGFVTGVEVASCDLATISTSLGTTADDIQSATGLCGNAANEASGHGVAAVSVVSEDGTELATGTDATDCAPAVQP